MKRTIAALGLAGALAGLAGAAGAQDVRALAPGAAPGAGNLNDLKGIVGDWAGKDAQAAFSAPAADQVVGHLVLLAPDGKPRIQEMWIFRPEGNSITLHQKHYDPALMDREDKGKWAERKLVAVDRNGVYLENLTWATHGDAIDLYVRIPGQNGAPANMLSYSLKRVK